jgi:hypothetical protein
MWQSRGGIGLLQSTACVILLVVLRVYFSITWGVLFFFLNFIPTLGFLLALIPPVIVAFLESGWEIALVVVIGYYVFHVAGEYIIRPRFMEKGFDISILTLMLSLIFWTWVLGPAGAVLAVPLTLAVTNLVTQYASEPGPRGDTRQRENALVPRTGRIVARACRAALDSVREGQALSRHEEKEKRVREARGISLFFQLQYSFTRTAARNPTCRKPQPPEDVEHALILGKDICPYFIKAPFPGYPDEDLYEFGPKVFPLEPIVHENGHFSGRQVLVHNKSCNPYHAFLSIFLYFRNYRHVPVVVDITEKDKPLMGYIFDKGEEPGSQCSLR